ncbi:hypothetical protein Tsubulata_040325 [Turnera subulata]|uniref:Pentatricopeptide repeat-containing protein n=1 Tax=Turnera subulata TaxID=218843 RepID=A0A9Q0G8J9_9ROSI|nr:hypothetical protein Tsubulata_040325 [Turnera subulata]
MFCFLAVSKMRAKKNAVSREKVAKHVDDTYRIMQIYALASKGQVASDTSNAKVNREMDDPFHSDVKVQGPCGSSLNRDSISQCEDTGCRVWQNLDYSLLIQQLSKSHQTLARTKQLHALITTLCLFHDPFYTTKIVRFYAMNNDLFSARQLFDKSPQRSIFLWNSMIRGYAQAHRFDDALRLYVKMLGSEIKPDSFTYACILRACCENSDLDGLSVVHCGVIVSGLGLDSVCCSALVAAYSKMSLVSEASKVFDRTLEPDMVLWNSMISGYACCGFWWKGLSLFNDMRMNWTTQADGYTLVGLISGLVDSSLMGIGQSVQGLCVKSGFDCNVHVGSALVSMYSRFGCMNSAYAVFMNIHQPDLVIWSSLITGYSQSQDYEKAMILFRNLNMDGKKADFILISSVLVAAAQSTHIRPGTEIHGYVLRHGFESNVMVSSALIDMYSKCGFVGLGVRVFDNMLNPNIVSYNSVISSFGLHGLASQAFQMFEKLLERRLQPDESTFSALLCACCHAGLVKDGWEIFRRMVDEFCIQPQTEHYIHIVKLLGTEGELEEAYNFVLSLKQPVDSGIWGALLCCCNYCGNAELAEIVAHRLFEDEPEKGAYRVMLSNIYAGNGKWDDVKMMRDDMTNSGVRKMPALSRI